MAAYAFCGAYCLTLCKSESGRNGQRKKRQGSMVPEKSSVSTPVLGVRRRGNRLFHGDGRNHSMWRIDGWMGNYLRGTGHFSFASL